MLRCYQVFSAKNFFLHKLYLNALRYLFLFDIFLTFVQLVQFKIINCLKNVISTPVLVLIPYTA